MKEKLKILITDDSEMNLQLFEALVKSFGHECATALNGQIACDLVQSESFDLILMDIEMPVLNGKETLNKIKSDQKNKMPIIALTAHKNNEIINDLINSGFDECLIKPFSKSDLNNIFLKFVNKKIPVSTPQVSINQINELYNLNYLRDMSDNDETLLIHLIETFIKLVHPTIKNIKNYYTTENFEALNIESHKFASQLNLIGAKRTSDYAATIEKFARAKENFNQIEQLIKNIENDSILILEELQTKFNFK